MKKAIMQYYVGNSPDWANKSFRSFKRYAETVGADHFVFNDSFMGASGDYANYYDSLRPIYDRQFDKYELVLFVDADILALTEDNIFEYSIKDVGAVLDRHSEDFDPNNPKEQTLFDNKGMFAFDIKAAGIWAEKYGKEAAPSISETDPGCMRFINSGVMLWSIEGRIKARERFLDYSDYSNIDFGDAQFEQLYQADQGYINCMLNKCDISVTELPRKFNYQRWNSGIRKDCFMHFTALKGKNLLRTYNDD